MSRPTNAREALIAELVGEVSALLDRVDSLAPAINATCDEIIRACADLEAHATRTERCIATVTEAAKVHAVKHIARRAGELARSSEKAQMEAMRRAVREVAHVELAPALRQVTQWQPQRSTDLRAGGAWWAYAATAICAAALGAAFAAYALSVWAP